MSNDVTIRKALLTDAPIIAGFNTAMAIETESKILEEKKISAGVENLFRHPEYGFYIAAEIENRVVGCLLITYEWSDWRNGLIWWIQSVYTNPEFRRRGIYRQMYSYIKTMALSAKNICGIRLYVEKENTTAQSTYKNLGMIETVYNMYEEMLA